MFIAVKGMDWCEYADAQADQLVITSLSLPVICQHLLGLPMFGTIEERFIGFKIRQYPLATIDKLIAGTDHHKVIATDMADKAVVRLVFH